MVIYYGKKNHPKQIQNKHLSRYMAFPFLPTLSIPFRHVKFFSGVPQEVSMDS